MRNWAELFRHFVDQDVDPFEVRRRVGYVDIDGLEVLDLTDTSVVSALGVTEADLVGDDYALTRSIAVFAAVAGFDGILAPSAALADRTTLVVFPLGMQAVTAGPSRVRQPPSRMADLLTSMKVHPGAPGTVHRN